MPDTKKILVGSPLQTKVTGAIKRAPIGTVLPESASDELDSAFTAGGYVDEEGVTLSPEISTTDIMDWKRTIVRKLVESFDGTVSFNYLEFGDVESLKQSYGDDAVTASAGRLKLSIGAHLPEPQSWVIDMKDGDTAVRIVIPNGQVTELSELTFVAGEAIKPGVTITTYDDGTGNSVYIYVDGEVVTV